MNERERFLREFEARLRLRGSRRADALAEVESHIVEAVEAGEDEASVVGRLGQPQEVALAFNRADARRSRPIVLGAGTLFAMATMVAAGMPNRPSAVNGPATVEMPYLIGVTVVEAESELARLGLRWRYGDQGAIHAIPAVGPRLPADPPADDRVYAQPADGARIESGSVVILETECAKLVLTDESACYSPTTVGRR